MSDDAEQTLSALDARLRALQAELEGGGQILQSSRGQTPPSVAGDDPLERFGVELRRLAAELVDAWDRVAAAERASARTRHRVVLEAQADLHALAALERALSASPQVAAVELRAYAGGHASLIVDVS